MEAETTQAEPAFDSSHLVSTGGCSTPRTTAPEPSRRDQTATPARPLISQPGIAFVSLLTMGPLFFRPSPGEGAARRFADAIHSPMLL